jgi:hypothetical protein
MTRPTACRASEAKTTCAPPPLFLAVSSAPLPRDPSPNHALHHTGGVFEPDREDGMPRMPPSDIHLQSPRQWSPISFAFLGDSVWELYIRRLFFAPPARPLEYDLKCKRAVRAEAQDAVLRHLIGGDFFSGESAPSDYNVLYQRPSRGCIVLRPREGCNEWGWMRGSYICAVWSEMTPFITRGAEFLSFRSLAQRRSSGS